MLKKLALFFTSILFLAACKPSTSDSYKITCTLSGENNNPIILSLFDGKKAVSLDTVMSKEEVYTFKGVLDQPAMLILKVEGQQPFLQFFGENSNITITGSVDSLFSAKVEGSQTNKIYIDFKDRIKKFDARTNELRSQYNDAMSNGKQDIAIEITKEFHALETTKKENIRQFISANATSSVSAYLALNIFMNDSFDQQKEIFGLLDTTLVQNNYYQVFLQNINRLEKLQVGNIAPDFNLTSKDGEEVSLTSLRGSYVLIDFWASWCKPCRLENPEMVKKYNQFNDKGFTLLSVSVDNNREEWLKAIKDDALTWTQLIDIEGLSAELYGIRYIPSTYLLDKEGVIIGVNLVGESLQK
ncbi:MAG: AhpC/TSA family protein, partial [Bacteroidales bacterium]|nr:AhpC/TSA family protein [Bacteroidales bacterium]